jgi:hypothetical protein
MNHHSTPENPDVFICYASKDSDLLKNPLSLIGCRKIKGFRRAN